MDEMKRYILAIYDKEIPRFPLPPRWELLKTDNYSKAIKQIADYCPYFLLVKNNINKEKALDFLNEISKRFGVIPPSIIVNSSSDEEIPLDDKKSLGIVAEFKEEAGFKAIFNEMKPYLKEPPLPRMTILEFLAYLSIEKSSGEYEFKISSSQLNILVRDGKIECLDDEVFRVTYRDLLAQGGLDLPEGEKDIRSDISKIEQIPFAERDKMKAVKEFALEKIFSEFPLDQNYKFTKISNQCLKGNLIGIEGSQIVRKLLDKIPLSGIGTLKKCSYQKIPLMEDLAKSCPLSPEDGYFLHILDRELSFDEIKNILGFPESVLLRKLYLFFLLGLISTNPSGGIPPRIQRLKDEISSKERIVFSQSISIEQFSQTLQIPGLSPYKVLGIDEKSTLIEAVEAYRNLEHLFSPEEIDPSVKKRYSKHLTFIRSKLTEAILLLQSFHLNEKHKRADILVSKMEITERMGSEKTEVQKTEEIRKKEAERLFSAAQEYFENNDIYEAGQYLKTALIYDPFSAPCRHLLALTYMKMKDTRSKYMAERELKLAIEYDPWNTKYILDLARLYIEVDMPNRAKALLEQAQRIDPNDPEIKTVRELIKKAN